MAERAYSDEYIYAKVPFPTSLHVELCLLKVRQRQAVLLENRCRVIQAIRRAVGVLGEGRGGRLIRLPYLGGKISGVFARGKEEPFVLVGCSGEFCRSKKGGRPFCVERFLVLFFYFLRERTRYRESSCWSVGVSFSRVPCIGVGLAGGCVCVCVAVVCWEPEGLLDGGFRRGGGGCAGRAASVLCERIAQWHSE